MIHFRMNLPQHFPFSELCDFDLQLALLKLLIPPRNLISSLNSLTCFRTVDDNLKTRIREQNNVFQAFETHEERNR